MLYWSICRLVEMHFGLNSTASTQTLFRHRRRMELDEQSGCTTGRLGYTWPTTAYAIGGTATRYSSPPPHPQGLLPPPALVLSDDCGPQEAVGACAPPPHPTGQQDLPRVYGPDGAAGGLSRSPPRQADDATPRPSGAGRRASPTTGTRSQTEYRLGQAFKGRSFNDIFFIKRHYV